MSEKAPQLLEIEKKIVNLQKEIEVLKAGGGATSADFANMSEAQAGTVDDAAMSPLNTQQFYDYRKATSGDVQGKTDDNKFVTVARAIQAVNENSNNDMSMQLVGGTLTSTEHNYDFEDKGVVIFFSGVVTTIITGFLAGRHGQRLYLHNGSTHDIALHSMDAGSLPENQLLHPDGLDKILPAMGVAEFVYEANTNQKWIIIGFKSYVATEADAQAGTSNRGWMTPLRTAQAITALGGGGSSGGGATIVGQAYSEMLKSTWGNNRWYRANQLVASVDNIVDDVNGLISGRVGMDGMVMGNLYRVTMDFSFFLQASSTLQAETEFVIHLSIDKDAFMLYDVHEGALAYPDGIDLVVKTTAMNSSFRARNVFYGYRYSSSFLPQIGFISNVYRKDANADSYTNYDSSFSSVMGASDALRMALIVEDLGAMP